MTKRRRKITRRQPPPGTEAVKKSDQAEDVIVDDVTRPSTSQAGPQEANGVSETPARCRPKSLSPIEDVELLAESGTGTEVLSSNPHRYEASPESSDSDVALVRPRHVKRRRILPGNLSAAVPVYSNKVISCLKLLPNDTSALTHMEKELQRIQGSEDLESEVVPEPQLTAQKSPVYSFSDSEDEAKTNTERSGLECQRIRDASPSPPPTPEVAAHRRGRAYHKIREVDAQLKDLGTVLSPSRKSLAEETDVILVDSSPAPEITLKVRRRGEVFRINMRTREPLQRLVEAMASQLKVEPSQILLLLRDEELDTTETPQSLHLTVADIIDCMVLSASDGQDPDQEGKICLKVQGKEKESHLSVFVQKTEPLQSLMDQYMAAMGLPKKTKISFIFEGQKLKGKSTAEELELETDDIIEVWL